MYVALADFDAIDQLNSGLGGLKLPPAQPTSHEYGAYLRQQREQRDACKYLSVCYIYCVYFMHNCLHSLWCLVDSDSRFSQTSLVT